MEEKRNRKKIEPPIERVLCPEGFSIIPSEHQLALCDLAGNFIKAVDYAVRKVRIIQNEEEKMKNRRMYRKEYMKRPKTIEKLREKLKDPRVIAERQQYANKPEVKERKKLLTKRARILKKIIKEKHPDIYNECLSETVNKINV